MFLCFLLSWIGYLCLWHSDYFLITFRVVIKTNWLIWWSYNRDSTGQLIWFQSKTSYYCIKQLWIPEQCAYLLLEQKVMFSFFFPYLKFKTQFSLQFIYNFISNESNIIICIDFYLNRVLSILLMKHAQVRWLKILSFTDKTWHKQMKFKLNC